MLKSTISFLSKLEKNNNLIWFNSNRQEYLQIKKDFEGFVNHLIGEMYQLDPLLGWLSVKDCVYRINRDIRFTKDKTPYKTWLAAAFAPGGKSGSKPLYYFHIDSKGKLILGAGMYNILPQHLAVLRNNISSKLEDFYEIIDDDKFKLLFQELKGQKLQKLPRGFDPQDPARDYLKFKSFYVARTLNIKDVNDENELAKEILNNFHVAYPFIKFLRENI